MFLEPLLEHPQSTDTCARETQRAAEAQLASSCRGEHRTAPRRSHHARSRYSRASFTGPAPANSAGASRYSKRTSTLPTAGGRPPASPAGRSGRSEYLQVKPRHIKGALGTRGRSRQKGVQGSEVESTPTGLIRHMVVHLGMLRQSTIKCKVNVKHIELRSKTFQN